MTNFIITISREFGSGGAEIGRKLASKLNIPYYDKNVNEFTAVKTGFSKETIEESQDKTPSAFTYGMLSYVKLPPLQDEIFFAQTEVIKSVASKGPCVIVGRCADYVLDGRKNVINIFIYAPFAERVKRIVKIHNVSEEQAQKMIKLNDKLRKRYHEHYSHGEWGHSKNYHITLNSAVGIDCAVETIFSLTTNIRQN
jgi:cytidylate kinase